MLSNWIKVTEPLKNSIYNLHEDTFESGGIYYLQRGSTQLIKIEKSLFNLKKLTSDYVKFLYKFERIERPYLIQNDQLEIKDVHVGSPCEKNFCGDKNKYECFESSYLIDSPSNCKCIKE